MALLDADCDPERFYVHLKGQSKEGEKENEEKKENEEEKKERRKTGIRTFYTLTL